MLTAAARIKNLCFVLVGALVLGFVGLRYADMGHYFGHRDYYTVTVELPEAGGLYPQAEVTYLGVEVGRVDAIRLTPAGAEARLRISRGAPPIPADLQAWVADLSAVGEQYLDLRPDHAGGPYLAVGATIPVTSTHVPEPVTNLLTGVERLADSVPRDALRTTVDELDLAFAGQADNLQVLLDNGDQFIQSASHAMPDLTNLLKNSQTVLKTQADEGAALTSFAHSAKTLATQLDASDRDFVNLVAAAPQAAGEVDKLLHQLDPNLSVLLANLLTTSDVMLTRQNGLQEFLVRVPAAAAEGSSVIGPDGALQLGMETTFFDPLPCTTGYGGTGYRNGLDVTPGAPLNTSAFCGLPPSSGVDVRGSANAPSGGLPSAAKPESAP